MTDCISRKNPGSFDIRHIVQGNQSMQRGVGDDGLHGAGLTIGAVKENGWADNSSPEQVKASAVKRIAVILNVGFIAESGFFPNAGRLVGLD